MTPPSNDDVIGNFPTGADQPVANQPIPIPNSIAELTNQSRSMQPSRDQWGPSGDEVIPSLSRSGN